MASSNKDQLHNRITELIDTLSTNNDRLQLQDQRFPQIEIDLLRKAAIELYDTINKLHFANLKSEAPTITKVEPVKPIIEPAPEEVIETVEEIKNVEAKPMAELKIESPKLVEKVKPPKETKTPVKDNSGSSKRLHEKLKNSKLASIKTGISISKRYELQHLLFQDNKALYEQCLKDIDSCSDLVSAETNLKRFSNDLGWDEESKIFTEFSSFVQRRFIE
jgi:hypothetical protein